MKSLVTLFADFNNADEKGRVRLNTNGLFEDLKTKNIILTQGMEVMLDDRDALKTIGVVEFSKSENIWVAKIDWDDLD